MTTEATTPGPEVRVRLEPGDRIAGILKDHDGRVIGYTVQAAVDGPARALLAAGDVGGYSVRFERQGRQIADIPSRDELIADLTRPKTGGQR